MNDELRKHTCCFFGHRRIKKTIETEQKLHSDCAEKKQKRLGRISAQQRYKTRI